MDNPNLKKLAKDLMNTGVVTASPETSGEILAHQLLSGQFSGLPVVQQDGEVVGVITEFDLLKAVQEGKVLAKCKAEDLMTLPPICVNEDCTLEKVLEKMIMHKIIRLPVVRNNKIIGVISRANILGQLVNLKSPPPHILPLCYWCEKVRDDTNGQPNQGVWCELQQYLAKHHLRSSDVNFTHVFCPRCAPKVKTLMGEQSLKSFES